MRVEIAVAAAKLILFQSMAADRLVLVNSANTTVYPPDEGLLLRFEGAFVRYGVVPS